MIPQGIILNQLKGQVLRRSHNHTFNLEWRYPWLRLPFDRDRVYRPDGVAACGHLCQRKSKTLVHQA